MRPLLHERDLDLRRRDRDRDLRRRERDRDLRRRDGHFTRIRLREPGSLREYVRCPTRRLERVRRRERVRRLERRRERPFVGHFALVLRFEPGSLRTYDRRPRVHDLLFFLNDLRRAIILFFYIIRIENIFILF